MSSYYHPQINNQNIQHSPHYHHQIPSAMMPHASNVIRAQQRSPTSPYTNPEATPTTSHQLSQMRYQQQQQQSQSSPYQQYQTYQQHPQPQPAPMNNIMNGIKVHSPQQQQHYMTQSPHHHPYHNTRSPSSPLTTATQYATAPPPTRPTNALPYSSSNDSNQNTPRSQRGSGFSPTIGSEFPDTLPVLDEAHHQTFNMQHPPLMGAYSSNESDKKATEAERPVARTTDGAAGMNTFELERDSDCEPIPSDEQKLSSSSTSSDIQRLIEQTETPSERAFLQQLSQMVLDETNIMSEIDEQMAENVEVEKDTVTTLEPSISRSASHGMALRLNMKAATISTRYDARRPQTTQPVNKSHGSYLVSPPRIKMPTANNMISCSSTATTPSTGADVSSPVTPSRGYYHRAPLSVTTTPNTYQYRQRQHQYHHTQYPHQYHAHNGYTNGRGRGYQTHAHLGSSLYATQTQPQPPQQLQHSQSTMTTSSNTTTHSNQNNSHRVHHHPIPATSMTPTPSINHRLRSKSVNQVSNGFNGTSHAPHTSHSMTASPQHHAHYGGHQHQHQGSMTPQHHNTRNRRSNSHGHGHGYGASRTDKIYSLLQQHGNCMKLSAFTAQYPQQFHEMLPTSNRDNNLLKYLVQLPRILVIKCKSEDDIQIFYCSESSHRTVIDILRRNEEIYEKEHGNNNGKEQYKGMLIDEFTERLSEKLGIDDLSDCNIVDFLGRWRVVELVDNNKYVRLMPMGSCTVFLGNLNPQIWNEDGVRKILRQINPAWYNLRIRLNQTNYGLLNAFIDFKSMKTAQSAIHEIKTHLALFEAKNTHNTNASPSYNQANAHTMFNYNNKEHAQSNTQLQHPQTQDNEIRVEIEQASAHKNVSSHHNYHHSHAHHHHHHKHNTKSPNSSKGGNSHNSPSFNQITTNIYKLIRESSGQMLMSEIAAEYEKKFNDKLEFDGNPKYFVKMERLLLLNCSDSDDVMIFFTPEPAYKLVVTILKQNPSGLSVEQFKTDLERRMSMTLTGCDFNDFLMRWRFLSIRECGNGKKMVLFTPHSGSTVFFGNLNVECTENDIYTDLEAADPSWKHSSVRLKLGKGFAYAFVDFPTRHDAMKAVQHFDGKQAFKSKYVSADIEAIEQRKRHHHHNGSNKRNRTRSYSHGNSPNSGTNNHTNNSNNNNSNSSNNKDSKPRPRSSSSASNNKQHNSSKTTVYLGNLRDDVTKNDIQAELKNFNSSWNHLTIRLNLRSGWSHAFVDFEQSQEARKLINAWNNRPNPLTSTRLRCEISKRQM
eukprot:9630_1